MRAAKTSKILVGARIEIDETITCKIFHSLEENWSAADEFRKFDSSASNE